MSCELDAPPGSGKNQAKRVLCGNAFGNAPVQRFSNSRPRRDAKRSESLAVESAHERSPNVTPIRQFRNTIRDARFTELVREGGLPVHVLRCEGSSGSV